MQNTASKHKNRTFAVALVGMMSAIATVIYMFFPEIPIVPGVSYMKIDFSDFPALLLGSVMGPLQGIAVGVIKNLIHLTKTTTFGIGEIMNVGVIAAMCIGQHLFTKLFARFFKKDRLSAVVYLPAAVLSVGLTVLAGWMLNGVLTPAFFMISGIPVTAESVFAGMTGSTLLNAVKAALNLFPFYPVYLIADKTYKKLG